MNYNEARLYLQDVQTSGIKLGLSRMRELCHRLGDPQDELKFIHIAGTNGKGSTAEYISAILGDSGYMTGRYVSPVVFRYEECIGYRDIDGMHFIDRDLFTHLVTRVADTVDDMVAEGIECPTSFEIETAVAFLAFCHWRCQVVLLEVGLGGREDATNVIKDPLVSVITPISRDHMHILGDTVTDIAKEKAGIIKKHSTVVSYQHEPEACDVIADVCRDRGASLVSVDPDKILPVCSDLAGSTFSYRGERYRTSMVGAYQIENAALAIETCMHLGPEYVISKEQLALGIKDAYWRGRFDVIHIDPLIIADGAHNISGIRALKGAISQLLPGYKIHGIMGVYADKEYIKMVEEISPAISDICTVSAPGPRGLPATKLAQVWKDAGCSNVCAKDSVQTALKEMVGRCKDREAIVIFGSLSLLSQLHWR